MAIDASLVPEGMEAKKEITPHCFINQEGEVIFLRKRNGKIFSQKFDDIHDAIWSCFHIIEENYNEVFSSYGRGPGIQGGNGEINEIKRVIGAIQSLIASLLTGDISRASAYFLKKTLDREIGNLGKVTNQRKIFLKEHIHTMPDVFDQKGYARADALVSLGKAQVSALERHQEIEHVLSGVKIQLKKLVSEALKSESRIAGIYRQLIRLYDISFSTIQIMYEKEGRNQPFEEEKNRLRNIARLVCGEGANLLRGFSGIVARPYKERVESREVTRLQKLNEYLDEWEAGQSERLQTFLKALAGALSKLKRVVAEKTARAEKRLADRIEEKNE